jgi:hypothetical protein
VTVSSDHYHRNLMVGQSNDGLALRWRSFLTGENGISPEIHFPGVFRAIQSQRIVVSYDGFTVRLHTSEGEADVDLFLGPEGGMSGILYEGSHRYLPVGRFMFWQPSLLLSIMVYLPLGVLLGLTLWVGQAEGFSVRWAVSGLFLPAILLEGFVMWFGKGELRPGMITLGVAVTVAGFVSIRCFLGRAP